ncbi:MAG: RNA polymerase sigma factor, partial [Myxococcales bacterium]|nr:RNA polymerase sigma factor [Myxococcales bacterium]
MSTETEIRTRISAVWRREAAIVVATLTRLTRDLGVAEELAQEALVVALERWPTTGIPDNPGAWLLTTGRHLALDRIRREQLAERKADVIREHTTPAEGPSIEDVLDDPIGDDVLRLAFIACAPVLSMDARVALTLRVLCGLSTDEIARAFLTTSPTIGQRIVRAKRALAGEPFELPRREALVARTASVLQVVYLVFNEGYSATSGEDLVRRDLCGEALRMGRMLVSWLPGEPEVVGLLALMEIQHSRAPARTDAEGNPVLLLDQDRDLWDREAITRGLAALTRAHLLGGRGPYVLQAEIAACHGRARRAEDTDWSAIAALYGELAARSPSPVVELNRALAVSMAEGPEAGLAILDTIADAPALKSYHLLSAARGDML